MLAILLFLLLSSAPEPGPVEPDLTADTDDDTWRFCWDTKDGKVCVDCWSTKDGGFSQCRIEGKLAGCYVEVDSTGATGECYDK